MKKKRIEIRQFAERLEQIQVRMNEITDLCEKENRARNDAENTEFETLRRESGIINARIQAANVNGGFVDVTDQAAAYSSSESSPFNSAYSFAPCLSRPLHPSVFEVLILQTNLDQANNLY